jgi:uncharacterized protein (DUF58 family)
MDAQVTREILKKVRLIEIHTNRLVNDVLAGEYHSVFKGRGMNFDEVREYVPGDEVRAIDWNVTARTGKPFVKKYIEERELTILLAIDVSASGEFGSVQYSKREVAAELASVLAFAAMKNHDKVGLILFSDHVENYIPPAKGRSHVLRVVRDILFYKPKGKKTNLVAPLDFIGRVLKKKAIVFLISDFCLPDPQEECLAAMAPKLEAINRYHDLAAVSICDPKELELPDIGLVTLQDAESGEQFEIDSSNPVLQKKFSEIAEKQRTEIRHAIWASGVSYLELSAGESYLPALLNFFSARQKKRR